LVEATGAFGGMSTNGLVPCFCPYNSSGGKSLIKGIGYEVLERLRAKQGVGDKGESIAWVTIEAEKLKIVYDEMVGECCCDFLFFSTVADVDMAGGAIRSVVILNKSGRSVVGARNFVDCTGDADLAFMAGAPTVKGDDDGMLQATTLCFLIAGIDVDAYSRFYEEMGGMNGLKKIIKEAREDGRLSETRNTEFKLLSDQLRRESGTLGLNFGHIYGIDGTDAGDLSEAMVAGRRLAYDFMEFCRKNIPGMAKAEVVNTGSLLGVRETRRIVGDFVLDGDAYFSGGRHDDDIAEYDYPIDVHKPVKLVEPEADNPYEELSKRQDKPVYGIPFRALVPRNVSNLLVAGRCISTDRLMQGSTRVMPACFATGEAAGAASAKFAGFE
jgi:hypothetical protein